MNSNIYNMCKMAGIISLTIISSGCSSSGDSPAPATTAVSGIVMAGPTQGASVTVTSTAGNIVAGPVTTEADGTYSIAIPTVHITDALIFKATGGTFTDEATAAGGVAMETLTSHAGAGTLRQGSTIAIDPSTTIIQKLIASGKTKAAAESVFVAAFGFIPDNAVKPVFAGMSSSATTPQRLAGLRAAAFSQLTKDLTLPPATQFGLITAIARDLEDGTLDGGYTVSNKTMPADISNRFGQALVGFQMSTYNKSKLTPDKIGAPVFNKISLTPDYRIEFIPGVTAAAMGKTTFRLKITNRIDNSPAGGLTNITLQPFMYMSSKSHTTPAMTVTESSTPGTYDGAVYYLMPSVMNGMSMGLWEIKVKIDTVNTAIFYPDVAMAMGTTALVKIMGVHDKIAGMAGLENRSYFLFNDGIAKEGMAPTYTVKLFTATKEAMTDFPAVYDGKILKNDSNGDWIVSGMTVEVSSDKTNWTALTDSGSGHWMVTGITPDLNNKIYVRLIVNGEQKTTDGAPIAVANGYQTITIVPGNGIAMNIP